jgi:hypothetical protein
LGDGPNAGIAPAGFPAPFYGAASRCSAMTSRKPPVEVERQRRANKEKRTAELRAARCKAASADYAATIEASAEENRRMLRRIGERIASEMDAERQSAMQEEFCRDVHLFRQNHISKARRLLSGILEPTKSGLPTLRYPKPGSLLEEECRWALVELLNSKKPPKDILRLVASLWVPDDSHPLANPFRNVAFKQRREGRPSSGAAGEIILTIVETAEKEKRGTDAGVNDAAAHYGISPQYIYEVLAKLRG